ncbi:YdcF family protein [Anaeroselena agilis]|uniref:YdcF family protein n=1 Tax=Anaeroselena agilis TaxID=3063788 RepID=A0ABU3P1N0_9FIRM|nr:YdcF family protein [Selenomonadales bacterium 4137-cl]
MYLVKFLYTVFLFPPGLFILALLIFAWWRRRSRALARAALLAAGLLYLASIGLVSGPLVHSLEARHTPPTRVSGDVIIVLGGGATLDTPNLGTGGHLYGSSANRLLTGLQLHHKLGVPIIYSGGQVFATGGVEAEIARSILLSLGVPGDKIIAETASLNTGDNARYTAAILAERGYTRPILVTSAYHMERAVRQFRKAGVAVLPYPTDYQENIRRAFHHTDLWPTPVAAGQLTLALKEYLGLAAVNWY